MSDLADLLTDLNLTTAELARRVGCSKSYLCHVKEGRKALGVPTAVRIWLKTRRKVGPLAGRSDADVRALARFHEAA